MSKSSPNRIVGGNGCYVFTSNLNAVSSRRVAWLPAREQPPKRVLIKSRKKTYCIVLVRHEYHLDSLRGGAVEEVKEGPDYLSRAYLQLSMLWLALGNISIE